MSYGMLTALEKYQIFIGRASFVVSENTAYLLPSCCIWSDVLSCIHFNVKLGRVCFQFG